MRQGVELVSILIDVALGAGNNAVLHQHQVVEKPVDGVDDEFSHCGWRFQSGVRNQIHHRFVAFMPDTCQYRDGELGYIGSQFIPVETEQVGSGSTPRMMATASKKLSCSNILSKAWMMDCSASFPCIRAGKRWW